MACIDKDKLMAELSTMYKSPTSSEDFMTVGYDHAIADVVVTVHEQPTADVVDKERYDRLLENSTIIAGALNKYQSADMVEVVRCKDCRHMTFDFGDTRYCNQIGCNICANDFCSMGERREDE